MNNEIKTVTALNGSRHSTGADAVSPAVRPVAEYAPHPCEPAFEVPALQQPPGLSSDRNEGLQLPIIEHSTCRDDLSRHSVPAAAEALSEGGSRIQHQPSSIVLRSPHHRERNGKIARLPKLERDMVNRMLHKAPDMLELLARMHGVGRTCPGLPAAQLKPNENPSSEESAAA